MGIDNDILFKPIKSVCTVFKPKSYKLYLPTVFIGSDALKFTKESKYLGFIFSDSKSDDCDIYVKTNETILYSGVARGASAPRRRLECNCQSSTRAVRVI